MPWTFSLLQSDKCQVRGLTWGYPEKWWSEFTVDVILGADCFYHEGDYEDLLHTITYFLTHNPHCRYVFQLYLYFPSPTHL